MIIGINNSAKDTYKYCIDAMHSTLGFEHMIENEISWDALLQSD